MIDRKLGRGLDYLIGDSARSGDLGGEGEVRSIDVDAIRPNPKQPRHEFDAEGLAELTDSIRENGVLQPLLVRAAAGHFQIVAGERRWRASRAAGLTTVPAIVRDIEDEKMLELALVENIQRRDLNPIERAEAYRAYIEELGLTQEEASKRLGKERSTISNTMRLLDLPDSVKAIVSRGTLSLGHARALLSVADDSRREGLALRAVEEGLSVRAVEKLARSYRGSSAARAEPAPRSAHLDDLEEQLRRALGTRVRIRESGGGKGKITVEFYTRDEFDRLFEQLTENRSR